MVRPRRIFAAGIRRWVLATGILCSTMSPALAEYHCWRGSRPIPGGPVGTDSDLVVTTTYFIDQPGCYWLRGNRKKTTAGPMITIRSSHVYLDLRGQSLTHAVASDTIINNSGPITDVTVVNGKLKGASRGFGVLFSSPGSDLLGDLNVSDLTIVDDGTNGVPDVGIGIGPGSSSTGPPHAVIARNMIDVSGIGISLSGVTDGRIEDNVLIGRNTAARDGILLNGCSGNDIRGNTITNIPGSPGAGIALVSGSSFNNLQHTTASACRTGILVRQSSNCNTLDSNVCMGNSGQGILLQIGSDHNVYSFSRTGCNPGGGVVDTTGLNNVNAGNNF